MLHTKFVEIGPPVPEKKILKCFYHIWAWQASWSCDQHHVNKIFISLYLKAFIQNFIQNLFQNGLVLSEKITFEMTLTFNTHIPSFSHLVVCIYQLSGHRLQ